MSDKSLRQKIVEAVTARLQTITTANGYQTNLGSKVFVWRLTPFQDSETPALNLFDRIDTIQKQTAGIWHHSLAFEIHIVTSAGTAPLETIRDQLIADVQKAIGVDRYWTVSGTRLAHDTDITSVEIGAAHGEKLEAQAKVLLSIEYRTKSFNCYS